MDDFFDDVPMEEKREKKGVNADMPPSNRAKQRKKICNTAVAVGLAAVSFVLGGFAVWFSLDKEIRTLIKIKKAINENYYQDIDDETFYGALFDTVNHKLLDGYSQYMTADEYKESKGSLAGNRVGIGAVFSTVDKEGKPRMLVTRVCGNSPAENAGLKEGDFVVAFGKTQESMTESEIFDEFSTFLYATQEGESFFMRVQRGDTTETLTMARGTYVENYVFYRTNTSSYGFTGEKADVWTKKGVPLSCLDNDTAYIRLIQFGDGTEKQFKNAMERFKADGKKNLVLDLRDNGGGYLSTMQEIAGYFCKNTTEKKPVVVVADYGEKQERFKAEKNVYAEYFSTDSRIWVLADAGTASASECLIGSMVDYGAIDFADICLLERNGKAKTFGKGIMQTTFYLSARLDAIKLTTAEIRWPVSGKSIHDRGVLPEDGAKTAAESIYGDEEIAGALLALRG